MACENVRDDILNALSDRSELGEDVTQHLSSCADCREFRASLEGDHRLLVEYSASADAILSRVEQRVRERIVAAGYSKELILAKYQRTATPWFRVAVTPRMVKAAAIATIVAATLVVGIFTGLLGRSEPAFASMLQQVQKATSVTYRETFQVEGRDPFSTQVAIREDGRMRSTMDRTGTVNIIDFNQGFTLSLQPTRRKAFVTQRVGRRPRRGLFNYISWLENLHKDSGTFIGQEELNGKPTDVFEVQHNRYRTFKIWVDPGRQLPVRVEMVSNPAPGIVVPRLTLSLRDFGGEGSDSRTISMSSSSGIQLRAKIVRSEFRWNVPLDDGLFDLTPPAGYDVERRQMDVSHNGEQDLVRALRMWAVLAGGQFPYSIEDLGDQEKVAPLLVAKYHKDGNPKDELDAALQAGNVLLKGLLFAEEMRTQGEWYYAGDGVRPDDEETPLGWWLPNGSELYRVVFGDLHIVDTTREQLEAIRNGSR